MADLTSDKYVLIRARLGVEPLDVLHTWDAARVPYEAMARLLYLETGVSITGATVQRWLRAAAVPS